MHCTSKLTVLQWKVPWDKHIRKLFLAQIEFQLFAKEKRYYPNLYCIYVYDIFATFDNKEAIKKFLKLLISQYPNCKSSKSNY